MSVHFDPFTLKTNGMTGIEYYARQSQFKTYWQPLAKMWVKIAKRNTIWGYDIKYGAHLPVTVDMDNGLDVDEMGNDLVAINPDTTKDAANPPSKRLEAEGEKK